MSTFFKFTFFVIWTIISLSCERHASSIEPNNKEPIVIQDAFSALPNSPGEEIWAMAVSPDGVLYAGVRDGLVRSFNNGTSWENIYSSGIPNVIYVSPTDSMILLSLAGSFITTTVFSLDTGKSWKHPSEPPQSSIGRYLSLPTGEILAGGYFHDESSGGIFISHDKGETWQRHPVLSSGLSVSSFALNSSSQVFALIIFSFPAYIPAIYRSQDHGQSWSEIAKFDTLRVFDLLINSHDNFIISSDKGLFVSQDEAQNWELLDPGFHNVFINDIVLDSEENLVMSVYDREDDTMKVLLIPSSATVWYSLEGLRLPTTGYYDVSILIDRANYIYLFSVKSPIYKSKYSIETILSLN